MLENYIDSLVSKVKELEAMMEVAEPAMQDYLEGAIETIEVIVAELKGMILHD